MGNNARQTAPPPASSFRWLIVGLFVATLAPALAATTAPAVDLSTSEGRNQTILPLTEDGPEAKVERLRRLAWRLWFMAQNLHPEASVLEPHFFDEALEAFSRLGLTKDPETGDHLVYVTGALAYAPVSALEKNPDHFKIADPETPFRIPSSELEDAELKAQIQAILDGLKESAPPGALRTTLSPAAQVHLVELLVFLERVLVRQANWLGHQWGKENVGEEEFKIASRLLVYITGVDGWSSGHAYLTRARAITLNYVFFKLDLTARTHGATDDTRRRELEEELAGRPLSDSASRKLQSLVADLVMDRWLAAQANISPEERVFVSPEEVQASISARLPKTKDAHGTVTFFPNTDRTRTLEDFDLEALRESGLDWRVLANLIWEQGAWQIGQLKTSGDGGRALMPLEHRAADRLAELMTHATVLLLGTAGEAALASGESTLSDVHLEEAARTLFPPKSAPMPSSKVAQGNAPLLFQDITEEVGIHPIENPLVVDGPDLTGPSIMAHDAFRGVATADYDGDDLPDLFISEERGQSRLYRNTSSGHFEDRTEGSGLEGIERVCGAYFADYDNDGCVDLLILRNHLSSLLYRNRCDGTFVDATQEAGLFLEHLPTTGAMWIDYDNDGHLDLYLILSGRFDQGFVPSRGDYQNAESNLLWRNRGDGTFEEVTQKAGVGDRGLGLAAAAVDFDNDGDQDIYIANDMQRNVLYENLGDGTFRDIARQAGVDDIGNGMGVSIGDVNSDGLMDMYLTNISAPPPPRFADTAQTNRLFLNRGDGTFEDVHKAQLGSTLTGWGWNGFFFDFDNDTHLDIYVINGFRPEFQPHNSEPNLLFRAKASEPGYDDVSSLSGVDFDGYSRGGVFFDQDGDGDLDLVLTGLHSPLVFRNQREGKAKDWIHLELVGSRSNRDGFGAKVKVVTGDTVQIAEMGNQGGGFISSINLPLHFGLGAAERADQVEIRWPSGAVQTFENLEGGRRHVIQEPEAD